MFKIIIFAFMLFLPLSQALGRVDARWFTVACIVLDDGETQIIFDPMFTRAGLKHWFNFAKLESDKSLVSSIMKDHQLNKIQAIFVSHSHFDHSIDAPIVSKLSGGMFYTDVSSDKIAKAYKDKDIKTQLIENLKPIQIGKFSVTPIRRVHAHIRTLGIDFLKGPVRDDFDFGFYDYRMGDTWFYYIEHPELSIILDQGADSFLNSISTFTNKVDVVIQGIANRVDDEIVVNRGYMTHLKPKIFIPTHFDNFFFSFDPKGEYSLLPGVRLEEVMEKMKNAHPDKKVIVPKYAEKIELVK
jgi:L-ascorbate metabolism protein UlaG (beta-lactamase superfamily)